MAAEVTLSRRVRAYSLDPDRPYEVKIFGLDTPHGEDHPLVDPRTRQRVPQSFLDGFLMPISRRPEFPEIQVMRHPEEGFLFAVDGQFRLRAWRDACDLLRSQGKPQDELPILRHVVLQGLDLEAVPLYRVRTENRVQSTPMQRAENALRLMLKCFKDEDQVATAYQRTVETVRTWVKVAQMPSIVRDFVHQEKISFTQATSLIGLPEDEMISRARAMAGVVVDDDTGPGDDEDADGRTAAKNPLKLTKATALRLLKDGEFVDTLSNDAVGLLKVAAGIPEGFEAVPGLAERMDWTFEKEPQEDDRQLSVTLELDGTIVNLDNVETALRHTSEMS